MAEIVTFKTPQEFLEFNHSFIYDDYFAHYHLIQKIEELKQGTYELFDCYNVCDSQGAMVLCMWVTGGYYIYSSNWNERIVKALSEKIELKKFKNFAFCGQRDLIIELFHLNAVPPVVFKNRHIEVCTKIGDAINYRGAFEFADFGDFGELLDMAYNYHLEEFQGQGGHKIEKE